MFGAFAPEAEAEAEAMTAVTCATAEASSTCWRNLTNALNLRVKMAAYVRTDWQSTNARVLRGSSAKTAMCLMDARTVLV